MMTVADGTASEARTDTRVTGRRVSQRMGADDVLKRILYGLMALWLFLFMLYPLFTLLKRSFQDRAGRFVGLENYIAYLSSPATSSSLRHSFNIGILSMAITVVLAFGYAYALTRTKIPGKSIFRTVSLLPMFIPSVVQALAFIYIFGNNGAFTRAFGVNIGLYGPVGIVMSEVFWAFPHALTILLTALATADARLYEAAESLGASSLRTFFTVTLPTVKYGLMSAAFVTFTLAITDFGAPKVVGGEYGVLATDIYAKVVGQQNFGMGAAVSAVLLIPTAVAFVLDRIVQRRQVAQITADIVPLAPKRSAPLVRVGLFCLCTLVTVYILSVYGMVFVGAFTKYWPYDLSLTLRNFSEFNVAGAHHGALHVLWNTIKMAVLTSLAGTAIIFSSAYLIERSRKLQSIRGVLYLLSIIPLSIPGTVLGLSYLFTFNNPSNPLHILYGTMAILAISTVFHYYTVPFLTATAALKQMDSEFEAVGESLNAPFYRTFWQVIVPLGLPSIIAIATYLFLNSLVTLSALVFLFVPGNEMASLMVMFLDDAGETAQAMAMALLILATGLASRGLFTFLMRGIALRMQAWRRRTVD